MKRRHAVTQLPHVVARGFERVCAIEDSLTDAVEVTQRIDLNAIGKGAKQKMTEQGRGGSTSEHCVPAGSKLSEIETAQTRDLDFD